MDCRVKPGNDDIWIGLKRTLRREAAVRLRDELLMIAEDEIDLRHRRKHCWVDLRGAAADDDLSPRLFAFRAADRLPRLPHCLRRDGAGVDEERILDTRPRRALRHHGGLDGVQAAAEGKGFKR